MGNKFFKRLGVEKIKQKMTYHKPTIFIGIVEQSFPMHRWTRLSLHHLLVSMAQDGFQLMEPYSPSPMESVAMVRNDIADNFKKSGADLLLMMDNDVIFPSDAFKFLWTQDQDVTAAVTVRTLPPHYPKLGKISKEGEEIIVKQVLDIDTKMAFRLGESGMADCVGLDFALFKKNVFEVLPKPWFYSPKSGDVILSDSWAFCLNALNKGLTILADAAIGVSIFKIGLYPFSLRDFQLYKEKGWAEAVDTVREDQNVMDAFKSKFRGIRIQDGIDAKEVIQPTTNN